ncbi:MAG: enoyl-CoA hydratase-related protein [Pseudomonadota bacterium]
MSYSQILVERRECVQLITLNRPEKLNAWTRTLNRELEQTISAANKDRDVGAIVITGAGRGFCAGADIQESFHAPLQAGEKPALNGGKNPGDSRWVQLMRESKPIVAAINGVAVGIGITMMLPADVIIASEKARIGLFFVRMGLVPELASTHFLVQRVGFALASEMCLTGRLYESSEIAGTGLVNRVVPHDELLDEALSVAEEMAGNSNPSLLMIKDLLTRNGACDDLEQVGLREHEALAAAYQTDEHREAVSAFMEKRRPDFQSVGEKST